MPRGKKTQVPEPTGQQIKKDKSWVEYAREFVQFLRDPKVKFFIGIGLFIFTLVLFLSFISFFFTWNDDQGVLNRSWFDLIGDDDAKVKNWGGKTGAVLSSKFIHDWFGLPSWAFIFLGFLTTLKLIRIELIPYRRTLYTSITAMILLSITFGYIFTDTWGGCWGGMHGLFLSRWLESFLGTFGTGVLILMSLATFWAVAFPKTFAIAKGKIKTKVLKMPETVVTETENKQTENKTIVTTNVQSVKQQVADIFENPFENKTDNKNTDVKQGSLFEKNSDETSLKQEFIISDDGKQKLVNSNLGFEVEVKRGSDEELIENELDKEDDEDILNPNEFDDVESDPNDPLAFRVQKNADIELNPEELPQGDYDPTLDLRDFKFPPVDLLAEHKSENSEVTNEELISNKNKIIETLRDYKIEIVKIKATVGPTITLYEIVPAPGVRISKIKNLEDDIALSLAALGIRIIAPMPGRGTIGIEVPNQKPEIVSMRSVVASAKFQSSKYELPIALGKTISNETFVADLAKMPHLLVAGATGQGKSVGLNAIITSLLYKKHPAELKLVLVDPKKVELTLYEKIERHYLATLPDAEEPIITDNQKVIHTVSSLNVEMDVRYNLLKDAQVRNIKEYNEKFISRRLNPIKGHRYLPYIVLVIDEFADLIMTAGKEIELPIARIAQLARAVGIHLIVATQRPSTNIITGVIKANFPSRLAFKVASMIDSRTILDSPGANQLIGRGDMLITQGSDLVRIQCAFIDTPEVEAIVNYIGNQRGYTSAFQLPEYEVEGGNGKDDVDLSKRDELFEDAARVVVAAQQGSTSLIQRKLSIGYNRAGRIMDQLEAAGIVGPFEGSKARQVLYMDELSLERFFSTMK